MSTVPEITKLATVIEPHLNGGKIRHYDSKYLTKPGDNYGSVMLAITARIEDKNNASDELHLIAKLPPITNEFYWDIFQPERTCIAEITMYTTVQPALRELQLEAGIAENELFNPFPAYYGSRISLNEAASKVDKNAVLVLENLQRSKGFVTADRLKMFDYAHAKLVLEGMAQYHALIIALRLKKPKVFKQLVRPSYGRFSLDSVLSAELKKQFYDDIIAEVKICTENDEKVLQRIKEIYNSYEDYTVAPDVADSIYTTIVHCDLWINNMMLQYDTNGAPIDLKFIDFQTTQYESMLHDVIFFLFSSVETSVLDSHFKSLLKIYYDSFLQSLQSVKVDTSVYTYDGLWQELRRLAPIEIYHSLHMIRVILAKRDNMPEDFKDMSVSANPSGGIAEITKKIGDIINLSQKFEIFY